MLLRIWMIIWKEFIQIFRDLRTLAVVVIMPVVMLMLYGYAINLDVKHIPMMVYDQDHSPESRELIGVFSRTEYFEIVAYTTDYRAIDQALDRGTARAALVIPTRFSRALMRGELAPVQLIVDGSNSTTASTAIGYAAQMIGQYSSRITIEALQRNGLNVSAEVMTPVDARLRFWYNPELKSSNFMVPGLIAVILMMLSSLLTSMTVVRERERGTIEQLIVSPVMPYELMIGKVAPYVVISMVDVILIIVAGKLLFNIPLLGSPALLLVLSAVYLMAVLGLGLFISAVSNSQQTAMTIAMTATQLPSVLLSGFFFPISAMPQVIQWFTYLIPARHFLVIVRSIFLKGVGFELLWQPALILFVYGIFMLWLSSNRFHKKL